MAKGDPKYLVYELEDPRIAVGFYVGKSSNGLDRPKAHMHDCNLVLEGNPNPFKVNVILKIRAAGLEPKINIIEVVSSFEEAGLAETEWIAEYRRVGVKLTNLTDGGDGGVPGFKMPESAKKKISESQLGPKNYMRGLKGEACPNFGVHPSEETRKLMSDARRGVPLSKETKANMSIAQTGANNANYCNPMLEAQRAELANKLSGEDHPMFGKSRPPEVAARISASKLAGAADLKRKICDELGNVFVNRKAAGEFWGINSLDVGKVLRGKRHSAGGHIFKYEETPNGE